MRERPNGTLARILALAAILAPVLVSLYFSWTESVATEKTLSLTYAQDALHRIEETASQFALGSDEVNQAAFPPCSPQDIEVLREVDLASNYVRATGRISGDTLLCTSQGVISPVLLGKPSLVSEHGVSEYYGVQLSSQQRLRFNVFAFKGFAIIVDPNLAIDVPTQGPDVELAVFVPSAPNRQRITSFGREFQPQWFLPIAKGARLSFFDKGFLVTKARSAKWDLSVVAAIPEHYVWRRVRYFAPIFVPIGLVCGALLAWAVGYITSVGSTFPVRVRQAARNRRFYVEYQPVVELESRRTIGAEALVRWKTSDGHVPPDFFIPLAEERGVIRIITDQVLSAVAHDLPGFLAINSEFRIAINLSAAELHSVETADALSRLLRSSGSEPRNIEIEATERAFLKGKETGDAINYLRKKGFKVAIDDFGTGYSSLACLQSLALDTLKIDRAFVETINTDGATSQVVLHIIEMAHSLGLEMIAEGVETEAQAEFLRQHGVRYAQGWLFGKPTTADALLKRMEPRLSIDPALTTGAYAVLKSESDSGAADSLPKAATLGHG